MFDVNSFTAIASKITPKILRVIFIPLGPIIRSIFDEVFKTIYINITFTITAIIMFSVWNSDFNDNKVVKLPGPAINGNANGNITIDDEMSKNEKFNVTRCHEADGALLDKLTPVIEPPGRPTPLRVSERGWFLTSRCIYHVWRTRNQNHVSGVRKLVLNHIIMWTNNFFIVEFI